jgi:hypothetical protein
MAARLSSGSEMRLEIGKISSPCAEGIRTAWGGDCSSMVTIVPAVGFGSGGDMAWASRMRSASVGIGTRFEQGARAGAMD